MDPSAKRKTSVLAAATLLITLNVFLWRDKSPLLSDVFSWVGVMSRRIRQNFNALGGSEQLLVCGLILVLVLLIGRRLRQRIARRKPPMPPPLPPQLQDYKRDVIRGIKWVWENVEAVEQGKLSAFCPNCSILLTKETTKKNNQRFTVFSCRRCERKFDPLEHDVPAAYKPIQDEIRRKVGSGEWKQTLRQPAVHQ